MKDTVISLSNVCDEWGYKFQIFVVCGSPTEENTT